MAVTTEKPAGAGLVACEVCMKEVPVSEATLAEATDYFAYFCGLQCLEQWRHRGDARPAQEQPAHA